jgi:hypothetical protein
MVDNQSSSHRYNRPIPYLKQNNLLHISLPVDTPPPSPLLLYRPAVTITTTAQLPLSHHHPTVTDTTSILSRLPAGCHFHLPILGWLLAQLSLSLYYIPSPAVTVTRLILGRLQVQLSSVTIPILGRLPVQLLFYCHNTYFRLVIGTAVIVTISIIVRFLVHLCLTTTPLGRLLSAVTATTPI